MIRELAKMRNRQTLLVLLFRFHSDSVSLHLEIAAPDEVRGVDAALDVLEDVIERVRNNASQLRRVVIPLHCMCFPATSLRFRQIHGVEEIVAYMIAESKRKSIKVVLQGTLH